MGFCDIDFIYSIILVSGSKYVCVYVCCCSFHFRAWLGLRKQDAQGREREREREHPKWIPMVATRQDSSGILMGKWWDIIHQLEIVMILMWSGEYGLKIHDHTHAHTHIIYIIISLRTVQLAASISGWLWSLVQKWGISALANVDGGTLHDSARQVGYTTKINHPTSPWPMTYVKLSEIRNVYWENKSNTI